MAEVIYNDVAISLVHTVQYLCKPVRSQDNVDPDYSEVTIDVAGIINLYQVAVQPPQLAVGGGNIKPGAAPVPPLILGPLTIEQVKQKLLEPRKRLVYRIIDSDGTYRTLIDSPALNPGSKTVHMLCDAQNGPLPNYCRISDITGDKTAIVFFSITTWVSDCDQLLLSNRWQITERISRDRYSTRITHGRIELRADLMRYFSQQPVNPLQALNPNQPPANDPDRLNADSFRNIAFPGCPPGYIRESVQVTVTSDGRAADYTVIDQEEPLSLKLINYQEITRIDGMVTGGTSTEATTPGSIWLGAIAARQGQGVVGTAVRVASAMIPVPKAMATIRVWGTRRATREKLIRVASQILLDRLMPLTLTDPQRTSAILSMYVSTSIDERFIEMRAECYPGVSVIGQALVPNFADKMSFVMQTEVNDIKINGLNVNGTFQAGDKDLASFGVQPTFNNRSYALVALLNQKLNPPCTLPRDPTYVQGKNSDLPSPI